MHFVKRQLIWRVTQSVFARQVGSTFASQLLVVGMSTATMIVIAHWLGPEGKGAVALILLVPAMLQLCLSGGLNIANIYFASSGKIGVPNLASNSVAFALLGTILGMAVVGLLMATGLLGVLVPGVPTVWIFIGMASLPVLLLHCFLAAILQGLRRIVVINTFDILRALLVLALTVALVVWLDLGVPGAVIATVVAGITILVLLGARLYQEGAVFRPRWQTPVVRSTLGFGLKGYVGNILQFFNYRFDLFIVNFFVGATGAGIYVISARLAELLWYLPNAVGFVIFPKAAATDHRTMNRFTPRVLQITFAITALGAVALALIGKPLIRLVLPPAFLAAYLPMLVLLPGTVLLGTAKILTSDLVGRGYAHYNSINAGVALVVTVVLDFALIPQLGVLGAAIASSIAYTLVFVLAVVFYLSVSRSQGRNPPGEGESDVEAVQEGKLPGSEALGPQQGT